MADGSAMIAMIGATKVSFASVGSTCSTSCDAAPTQEHSSDACRSSGKEMAGVLLCASSPFLARKMCQGERASRRLMLVHLALGDATAALQVYATCRARLAEELQVEPSADTITLAAHIRTSAARLPGSRPAHPPSTENQPPGDLIAPLVGRASAFTQLASCYQQARLGQPQTALLGGEADMGKTGLANRVLARG